MIFRFIKNEKISKVPQNKKSQVTLKKIHAVLKEDIYQKIYLQPLSQLMQYFYKLINAMTSYSEKISTYRQKNKISIAFIEGHVYSLQQENLNSQKNHESSSQIQYSNSSSSVIRDGQSQNNRTKISDIPQQSYQYTSSQANESPKVEFYYNDECLQKRDFYKSSAFYLKPESTDKNNQHPLCKSLISAICVSEMENQDLDHSNLHPLMFSENEDFNHTTNKDIQRFLMSVKYYYAQMRKHILSNFQQLKDLYNKFSVQLAKVVQQKFISTVKQNNDKVAQKNKEIEALRKKLEAAEKQADITNKRACPKCEDLQRLSKTKSKNKSKENEETYLKQKNIQLQAKLQETRKTCERLRYSLKDKQNKESQLIGDNKIVTQKLNEIMQKYENLQKNLQGQSKNKARKNSVNIKLLKKYSQNEYLQQIDSAQESQSRARSDAVKNYSDKDSMMAPTLQYKERQYVQNIAQEQDQTVDYQFVKKSTSFKANEEKSDLMKEIQNNNQGIEEQTSKISSQATKKVQGKNKLKEPYFRKEKNKRIQEYQDELQQNQYDCEDEYDQNYFNNKETQPNKGRISPCQKSGQCSPISRKNKRSIGFQQQQLQHSMYMFNPNSNFNEKHFEEKQSSHFHCHDQPNRYLKASHMTNVNKESFIGKLQTNQFSQVHPTQNNRSMNTGKKPLRRDQSNTPKSNSIEKINKGYARMQLSSSPIHSPYLKNSTFTSTKQTYYLAKRSYAPSVIYNGLQDRYQNNKAYQKNARYVNHFQDNTSFKKQKSREKRMSPQKRNDNCSNQLNLNNFAKASVLAYQYQDKSNNNFLPQKSKKKGIIKIQQKIQKLKQQFSRGSEQY